MIKNLILLYFILYFIVYCRLSKLDKYVLPSLYTILQANMNCLNYSIIIKIIILILVLPFKFFIDKYTLAKVFEGALYNIHKVDINLINKSEDKLYMNKFFVKHNIPVSELFGYSDKDGKLNLVKNIDSNMEYVIKPRYGCLGYGIYKVKGVDILKTKIFEPNIIIERLLKDCFNNNLARHYRVVTLYSGELFTIIQLSQTNNKIASNHANGGIGIIVDKINPTLEILINKLKLTHKLSWSNIFSIGWDLMLDCNNKNINAYVLELNIGHSAIFEKITSVKDIKKYIKHAKLFYNINKI